MKRYIIKKYESTEVDKWNAFIAQAKNATFLFHRNFMEYHSDRFEDCSLMVFDEKKLITVLPAHQKGNILYSHQGLTYGGWIYKEDVKINTLIEIVKQTLEFLENEGIGCLSLKQIPHIYHQKPAQEIEYLLFILQAKTYRKDMLSVLDLSQSNKYTELRKRGIKKALKNGLEIREEQDLGKFWTEVLEPNLAQRHGIKPVHTYQEIQSLKEYFPKHIRQFSVYLDNQIIAGTTVFETATVAHAQYISSNIHGISLGSLDLLFHELITITYAHKPFFDFGNSNEEQGTKINAGLCYWKESFGASGVVQEFYIVETSMHKLLDNLLL